MKLRPNTLKVHIPGTREHDEPAFFPVNRVLNEYGGEHYYIATIGGSFVPYVMLVAGDTWEEAWANLIDHDEIRDHIGVDFDELSDDERAQLERGEMVPGCEYNDSGQLVATDWLDMRPDPIW